MTEPAPQWVILPGDPPELKRWLARRQPRATATGDVAPPPDEPPPEDP